MAEDKMVFVELAARCYVGKEVKEEGDIVSLPKSIAESFGKIIPKVKAVEEIEKAEEANK